MGAQEVHRARCQVCRLVGRAQDRSGLDSDVGRHAPEPGQEIGCDGVDVQVATICSVQDGDSHLGVVRPLPRFPPETATTLHSDVGAGTGMGELIAGAQGVTGGRSEYCAQDPIGHALVTDPVVRRGLQVGRTADRRIDFGTDVLGPVLDEATLVRHFR